MLSNKDIEYYVFTNCNYCDDKVKKIYYDLMKEYNTDLDGLDDLYFNKRGNYIEKLNIKQLNIFLISIKNILLDYCKEKNKEFYLSYFGILEGLINNILLGEYGKLAYKFKISKKIKKYLLSELYEIIYYYSNDYSKVGFFIDKIKGIKPNNLNNVKYDYWDKFKAMIENNKDKWSDKKERKMLIENFENEYREKNIKNQK